MMIKILLMIMIMMTMLDAYNNCNINKLNHL